LTFEAKNDIIIDIDIIENMLKSTTENEKLRNIFMLTEDNSRILTCEHLDCKMLASILQSFVSF